MDNLGLLNEERIRSGNQNKPLINFSRGIIIPNADNVTKYAEELARTYAQNCDLKEKKSKGQFFTSKEIGLFMASMFEINKTSFNILDPGAGIGMLSAFLILRNILWKRTFLAVRINQFTMTMLFQIRLITS